MFPFWQLLPFEIAVKNRKPKRAVELWKLLKAHVPEKFCVWGFGG